MSAEMTVARVSYVLIGLAAGLVVLPWMLSAGLADASTVTHAVTIVATSLVAMAATAVGALMVLDWQADVQSRHEWAQLGLTPAHLCVVVEPAPARDFDPRYLATANDEVLRRLFLTHRAAAQMARSVPAPAPSAEPASAAAAWDRGRDAGALSIADPCARILRELASTPTPVARTLRVRSIERRTEDAAPRLRLVANGDAWLDWPAPICPRADRAADLLVLSADRNNRVQPSPARASVVPNGTESTARPACRGSPRPIARRHDTAGSIAAQQRAARSDASAGNVIVRDDLGPQIPISSAELNVVETYLGRLIDDVLASSTAKPDSDKS